MRSDAIPVPTAPVVNEADLASTYLATALQAARFVHRRRGLGNIIETGEVEAQARLALIEVLRLLPSEERTNERRVYWRIVSRLSHWVEKYTQNGQRWAFLKTSALDVRGDEWYEIRDLTLRWPDLAALDHCFLDSLNDAWRLLPPQLREAFLVGVERSGENLYQAADRLGVSKSLIFKRRQSADMQLLGLLQSRGWLTGVSDDDARGSVLPKGTET